MNKAYIYVDENSKEWAEKYPKDLRALNTAVFFIGENYDPERLKIELNHIVSKGYNLIMVLNGEPYFDGGISLQMGLAKIIKDGDDAAKQLNEMLSKEKLPKNHLGIVIGIILAIAIAALSIILIPKKEEKIKVDNLSLNETYKKALIAAGADCIVVDGGISEEEMLTLEVLDLSGLDIEDLSPILYAKNLRELNLSNNNISDITDLAALSKLEKLDLSGNPINNYGILDYLPQLTEIIK